MCYNSWCFIARLIIFNHIPQITIFKLDYIIMEKRPNAIIQYYNIVYYIFKLDDQQLLNEIKNMKHFILI